MLDAAIGAGTPRIVHVSTVNVFGNTHGEIVDETYRRPGNDFLSYYDETKYRAHLAAEERIAAGAPVSIAMPGGVYGPGDHSEVGSVIDQLRDDTLRMRTFPELGMNLAHVDDIAAGIVLVGDLGHTGESYVIGGEIVRFGEVLDMVGRLTGHRAPRFAVPVWMMKAAIPAGPLIGKAMGTGPNLREMITARRPGDLLGNRREGQEGTRLHLARPRDRPAPDARRVEVDRSGLRAPCPTASRNGTS